MLLLILLVHVCAAFPFDNTNIIPVNKFTKHYYALCWTDNYTLKYNNNIVLEMVAQRT